MKTRLQDIREEHDLKQSEVAKILKVSQSSYSRYENEIKDISINKLKQLSIYYNNSIDYILYMTDKKERYKSSTTNINNKNRLKELRIKSRKTQKQIATELCMPLRTYIKYENQTRSLNMLILCAFAKHYNTSTDYIVYHTDEITPFSRSLVNWSLKE